MELKNLFFLFAIIMSGSYATAQTIKVNNGISFSSFNSDQFDVLEKRVNSYAFGIGMDYLNKKQFYISSEVGYLKIGGAEQNPNLSGELSKIEETWGFIQLNSTFRLKIFSNSDRHVFVGVGPKADLLVSDENFNSEVYSPYYKMEKFSMGGKTEIGIVRDIDRIRLGLNASYLFDVGKKIDSGSVNLKSEIYQIMFTIGYNL